MGKSSGSPSGSTQTQTVQKADPWSAQQPYLQYGFGQAQDIYQGGAPGYYPDETVAPFSPETNAALNAQTARALSGSPLTAAAQQQLTDTMSGKYLDINTNPYMMPMAQNIAAQVLPQINAGFEGAGRYGSPSSQRAASYGLTDALATQAYNNYNNERTRQTQGMLFAPSLANQDYTDISQLADVGAQKEGLAQAQINSNVDKYNYNANLPNNWLSQFMNLVQGNYGGTSSGTVSSPYYSNRAASGLGGAVGGGALGYGAGSALGIDPSIAALAGGAGGGLLGLFG